MGPVAISIKREKVNIDHRLRDPMGRQIIDVNAKPNTEQNVLQQYRVIVRTSEVYTFYLLRCYIHVFPYWKKESLGRRVAWAHNLLMWKFCIQRLVSDEIALCLIIIRPNSTLSDCEIAKVLLLKDLIYFFILLFITFFSWECWEVWYWRTHYPVQHVFLIVLGDFQLKT